MMKPDATPEKPPPSPADALRRIEPRAWSSEDAEQWHELALVYAQLNRLPEAEAAWRRALQLQPGHPVALARLADLLLQQGLPYSAMRVLHSAAAAGAPDADWQPRLQQLQAAYPVHRVSVYTPGYGAEDYLERCLRSIQSQTYPIHEILLVDDRSPDGSTAIALRHGVRVFYHDDNRGLAASCNTALQHCTGDFLAKIDSDLELHPTWLERAMLAFQGARTAGVGGKLVEYRTATIPDQWRRVFMAQHWGTNRLEDAPGLFGADCLFRVDALKASGGWNVRYRTNFEDMDLSLRLKAAGWRLVYEPLAWARHLRHDRLHDVLRNFWNWYYPPLQDQGGYESLAQAAACLAVHRKLAAERINTGITQGQIELTYPTFLLYFWCCIRDLQHVLRRGQAAREAVSQTGMGVYGILRWQLRSCAGISGQVVERTLNDLKACLRPLLTEVEQAILESEAASEESPPSPELPLQALRERLPQAEPRYLEAFARESFLSLFGPAQGAVLDLALQRLEREEQEQAERRQVQACWVIFNPPGTTPNDAGDRWLVPSRIRKLADRLRDPERWVYLLDAAAQRLDEREAFERVLGLEPAAVVFSAAEGGLDRLAAAARRLKLVEGVKFRLILVWAGQGVAPGELPMFDEVHEGLPP